MVGRVCGYLVLIFSGFFISSEGVDLQIESICPTNGTVLCDVCELSSERDITKILCGTAGLMASYSRLT